MKEQNYTDIEKLFVESETMLAQRKNVRRSGGALWISG